MAGVLAGREGWGLRTGCGVGFARTETWAGWHLHEVQRPLGEFLPPRRRKQEGASNLLNLCIDKLSSSSSGRLP